MTNTSFRIETDTMGEVRVPAEKYWGAQTERSRNNFRIGPEGSIPKEVIHAFAVLKKAAALTNQDLGVLTAEKENMQQAERAGKTYRRQHCSRSPDPQAQQQCVAEPSCRNMSGKQQRLRREHRIVQ